MHNLNTFKKQIMNIEHFENVQNLLEATGLNWEVKKEPIVHPSGLVTEHYGLYQYHLGDTQPTQCFNVVKGRYTIFQNSAMADTILRATENMDVDVSKGGSLLGGSKVYLQAKLDDVYIGKSDVKRYLTVLNSHDGSASIGFGSTNTVVACSNSFHYAHKEVSKFRHTESAQERIDSAIKSFRDTLKADKDMYDNFLKMSETRPTEHIVQAVIKNIFSLDPVSTKQSDVSTRKVNQLREFANAYSIERDLEGDTLWGLFNAVTRYTNHVVNHSSEQKKNDYIMSGGGLKISNNAYDTIMQFIDSNLSTNTKVFAV